MQIDDSPALRKSLAALRPLCARLPGAEEYVIGSRLPLVALDGLGVVIVAYGSERPGS
jgi:hypothetical protein